MEEEEEKRFQITYDQKIAELLSELKSVIAISTYQAGKVIFIGAKDGKLVQTPISFKKPMGIALKDNNLAIATLDEIQIYSNSKDLAKKFISKKENYDRKYYTGYLGPWRLNNDLRLFVNLRCMEVKDDHLVLYAGGGITSKSVPEKEWEETIQKASTLLSVINSNNE